MSVVANRLDRARRLLVRRTASVTAFGLVAAAVALAPSPAQASPAASPYSTAWAFNNPGVHRSSTTLGELSVGRVVLAADMNGWLQAIRADGSVAWHVPVDPHPGVRTAVESSPATGDLNGDGQNEVVVGAGSIDPNQLTQPGGVVAYRGDGSVLWRWLAPDRFGPRGVPDGTPDGIYSSPAIGDVNGDGRPDVVFGGWDHNIWALNGADGSVLPGFPFENTDTVFSSPALYDTNGDGALDIIIGGDQSNNPAVPGSYDGGVLRVLTAVGGHVTELMRRNVPDIVASSPAIGDIDGDGRVEAIFSTGNFWHALAGRAVWAVHLDDGSDVHGWPQATSGEMFGSPALGDVIPGDGGLKEVVAADLDGNVYAWRGNGALAWKTAPGPGANSTLYGGPSIGDLDGNGTQDVAIGWGFGGALLLNGQNGLLMQHVVAAPDASEGTPLIADFGGSVGRRLIVSGWNPNVANWGSGQIASFVLPGSTAVPDWPMFHKDPRHLGGSPDLPMVHGSILVRYDALGGAAGFLGQALTPELATPLLFGRYNHFQGGSIYWSPVSGAWEVHGAIRGAWSALGWENSLLGFPQTNENRLIGGAFSRFMGGSIYWSPGSGAHEVHGAIAAAWGRSGWENGPVGYPITNETGTPTKPGAFNHFQGGSVYWSPNTDAHVVVGAVRDAWARAGWENSCLGFPVTDTHAVVTAGTTYQVSDFQGGVIRWSARGGAVVTCA